MKTATLERYHVWGTPNHCLALFYRNEELTPRENPALPGHRALPAWIRDDDAGIAQLVSHARSLGFTHVKFEGDWSKRTIRKTMRIEVEA